MLNYYKINDPYRLISIFLLLFLFRLPVYLSSDPLIIPELKWMIIGEELAEGDTLYVDIWDEIAPLSAGVYWFIHEIFGRSQLTYQILSFILVSFQSFLFNSLLLKNNAYQQGTYVPAFIYGTLMSVFFDFYTLSPVLISITFILLAINNLFSHIEFRAKRDEQILNIGLYLGIAALFYLPSSIFFLATIIVLIIFTTTVIRRFILIIYGFLLPLLLTSVYFFFIDAFNDFYNQFLMSLFRMEGESYILFESFLVLLAIPVFFLVLSFLRLLRRTRFTNYQISLAQIMFLIFILTFFVFFFFTDNRSPHTLIIFVPTVSFFISHFFQLMKRSFLAEFSFFSFWFPVVFLNLGAYYNYFNMEELVDKENLLTQSTPWDDIVEGKEVLLIDNNISVYKNSKLATPFFSFELASEVFRTPDTYGNIALVYKHLKYDPPEVIIDPHQLLPEFLERMPDIRDSYSRSNEIYLIR